MISNALRNGLFSAFLVLLSVIYGYTQVDRGGLVGTVTDSSGAVVPGVTVRLVMSETGQVTKVTSDAAGQYVATLLRIGTYTVTAEKQGFQKTVQQNVIVGVNQVVRVDFALQVGRTNQEVTVTAAPPQVESQSSSLGTIEGEQRIVDLPLNGRNFFQLAFLGPGADSGGQASVAYAGGTDNNRPGMALAVNGLDNFNNNFLLDGVDNNEFGDGTVIVQPAPDAIQEFRVEENSMKAEFGRGGASVNLVLKSGTNRLHGGAYEFIRNDDLDARNFFDASRAPFQRNQYGGLLGGPIKKDRTFIFGDYQGSPIREGQTFISTVPDALERAGNFTELGTAIYNPYTTDPTTGERQLLNPSNPYVIPGGAGGSINSVGQAVLDLYPSPNLPGLINNYLLNPKAVTNANQFDIRLDHRISDRDQVFFHDAFQQVSFLKPAPLGSDGGCCGGYGSNIDGRYQSWGAGWTHTLSPSVVNDLHGGFFRFRLHSVHVDSGQNRSEALGIPNANRGDINSSGLSLFNIGDLTTSGDAPWVPEIAADNTYQLADTLSWVHGKHTIKFGGDFRRRQRNFFQADAPFGNFMFGGAFSSDPLLGGGNAMADVLLGLPVTKEQDTLAHEDATRYWDLAAFAQDDFRVTPNLTLNLGIRYDLFSPVSGKVGNFSFQTLTVIDSFGSGAVPHGGLKYDKTDIGPRIGFAYTPFGDKRTVIRSAFGIFYAPEGNAFNDLGENPPNLEFYSYTFSPSIVPTSQQLISTGFPATMPLSNPADPSGQVKTTGPVHLLPYVMEWNFNVERQLAPNWVLEVGYVGTRGLRIWENESGNLDQPPQPLDSNFSDPTGNVGRPYFSSLPNLNTINPVDYPQFDMFYNALDVKLNKHFSSGLNLLLAYTWAKDLGTDVGIPGNLPGTGLLQNVDNIAQEKGYVGASIEHRFSASYLYQLPFGRGKHFGSNTSRPVDLAFGGWEVSGITTMHTGEHEIADTSSDFTNTGTYGPWPDRIHNPNDFSFNTAGQAALGCSKPGTRTLDCWYNPAAFVIPPLAPGQNFAHEFGNSGNGILLGPGQVNFDFALIKYFKPTERMMVEFRAEFFNILNHPQFALPNVTPDVQGGASVTSTLLDNQREIQFGLKLTF